MKDGTIPDKQITASSIYRTWGLNAFSWYPFYGRLDKQGKFNAWTAQTNDASEWLQVGRDSGLRGWGWVGATGLLIFDLRPAGAPVPQQGVYENPCSSSALFFLLPRAPPSDSATGEGEGGGTQGCFHQDKAPSPTRRKGWGVCVAVEP